jgi:hypothetical protein
LFGFLTTKLHNSISVTKFWGQKYFREALLNALIISALKNAILPIFQLIDNQAVTNAVLEGC